MRNFIKQTSKPFSILAVTLIIGGAITSCSSSVSEKVEPVKGSATTEENKSIAVENKKTSPNEISATAQNKQINGLPEFKKGEDYKSSVRVKMLKAGWTPARSEDGELCGSGDSTCDEYPEFESHAGNGQKNDKFRWQRADKFAVILTVGDTYRGKPYKYDGYEFEKASETSGATADEKWQSFWSEFKTAVNKQDAKSLRKLMADNITGGGDDSTTASQWLDSIQKNNSWTMYKKSIASGTEASKCKNPCRITKGGYLIFEYENGKWLWTSLGGEGGGDEN